MAFSLFNKFHFKKLSSWEHLLFYSEYAHSAGFSHLLSVTKLGIVMFKTSYILWGKNLLSASLKANGNHISPAGNMELPFGKQTFLSMSLNKDFIHQIYVCLLIDTAMKR